MFHHIIVGITWLALIGAFIVAVVWWFLPNFKLEQVATALAIFAAITGLLAEPMIAQRNKRHDILYALGHELLINKRILFEDEKLKSGSNPMVVYSRLITSIAEYAIFSGAFISHKDRDFFKLLHTWRQAANEFNHRLDIIELETFTSTSPEIPVKRKEQFCKGEVLSYTRETLKQVTNYFLDHYSNGSGIKRDTLLF